MDFRIYSCYSDPDLDRVLKLAGHQDKNQIISYYADIRKFGYVINKTYPDIQESV